MTTEALSEALEEKDLRNGRIYFHTKYKSTVFNGISIGGRRSKANGERDLGTVVEITGVLSDGSEKKYDKAHHDIRLSGAGENWLSPRADIRAWIIDRNAKVGDVVSMTRISEFGYHIDLVRH